MKDRPTPASYITIKIVISYKISRIFFFLSFSFSLRYTLNWNYLSIPEVKQKFFPFLIFSYISAVWCRYTYRFIFILYFFVIPTNVAVYRKFSWLVRIVLTRQWPRAVTNTHCSQFNQQNTFSSFSFFFSVPSVRRSIEETHSRDATVDFTVMKSKRFYTGDYAMRCCTIFY